MKSYLVQLPAVFAPVACGAISLVSFALAGRSAAAELIGIEVVMHQQFGAIISLSGGTVIGGVPSYGPNDAQDGIAYLFRGVDTATGIVNESARLRASDPARFDAFGRSVSVWGNSALISCPGDDDVAPQSGAIYLFRGLDAATGTVYENAKLVASDGLETDQLGTSVSLSGDIGIAGATSADPLAVRSGAAYVFRGLSSATGTVDESVKLLPSDGGFDHYFGNKVSLSGSIGLVTAVYADHNGEDSGAAYVFRNLDTRSGTITQDLKLVASDNAAYDRFGSDASLSGSMALVGAYLDKDKGNNSGSAYLFRGLDAATGTINQSAKLMASDAVANHQFGTVTLSGTTGIVGAHQDGAKGLNAGAAYIFLNLDTAAGTINENVKIVASDGLTYNRFGADLSLDGDHFVIGSTFGDGMGENTGKAYSGSVSSLTTLDSGNRSLTIRGISFSTRGDWVIGQTVDRNSVTLSAGDTADITVAGKEVYIGQHAGSDHNTLDIAGILRANTVNIGTPTGSVGNALVLRSTANIANAVEFIMGEHSELRIQGDLTAPGALMAYLGSSDLRIWDEGTLRTVDNGNQSSLLHGVFAGGFTTFSQVPEPSSLVISLAGILSLFRRRR